jgi:outer membrane protein OmpA-like peptidoglycan-associated protein
MGQLQTALRDGALAETEDLRRELEVRRRGQTVPPRINMRLAIGDTIRTGAAIRAIIHFRAGYQVLLGPNTEVVLHNPSINLAAGKAYVATVVQRTRARFEWRTEWGAALPQGTQFLITADGDSTLIAVVTGTVTVTPVAAREMPFAVNALLQTTVDATLDTPTVIPLQPSVQDTIRALLPPFPFPTLQPGRPQPPVQPRPDEPRPVDSVQIPDFVGVNLGDVVAQAREVGIQIGTITKVGAPALVGLPVVEQHPAAGTLVPRGTLVNLEVGTAAPVVDISHLASLVEQLSIPFGTGESTILPGSVPRLDAVGAVLNQVPDARLEIAGHADSRGSEGYNQALSHARATAVFEYLRLQAGIDPGRMQVLAFGTTRPLGDNTSPTGRALNRRVEFRLLLPHPR